MDPRRQLIEKIRLQGLPTPDGVTPLPVVSLEDFFIGNDDPGSIGCNLPQPAPDPPRFFEVLKAIRERPDVTDVVVEIHEVEESDESMWPFSDRVYVVTSASQDAIKQWVAELQPDEVEEGYAAGRPPAGPEVKAPYKIWGIWWD
jgi:hypothetical protein